MNVSELFDRCLQLTAVEQPTTRALRQLHETLVAACAEALRGTRQGFGNLFAQVDYLCKLHDIAVPERIAIQQARRHSNGEGEPTAEDLRYDLRAVTLFIAAIFHITVPAQLLAVLPTQSRENRHSAPGTSLSYLRCIVTHSDGTRIFATTADSALCIDSSLCIDTVDAVNAVDAPSLPPLPEGTQLNLLDSSIKDGVITPGLIVVEPDYLIDISSVAACFQNYGHHPVSYLLQRLKPRANSQPILLGNFAGTALDALIHQHDFRFADMLRDTFCQQALQFCTCEGFNAQHFKEEASRQVANIREAVDILFSEYDRSRALLEPSFVCERLGLQGRVDLMTDDMRLLVEQKSGKKWGQYQESHYVQLLLYYGVLRYNFHLSADQSDIRLLYSKYPARDGLIVINFYRQLFREAISLRNHIVAQEIRMAREGFSTIVPQLKADILLENQQSSDFFNRYIRPQTDQLLTPLTLLSPTERDYVERMLTFVFREQLAQKIGVQEGQGGAQSDLWNMPLSEKIETGNILMGLQPLCPPCSGGVSDVSLSRGDEESCNFRRGDMVYLYRYEDTPDVRSAILYKGVIAQLTDREVIIRLNNAQHNPNVFRQGNYAIEHASSDITATAALRSICAFSTADKQKRDLLLGLRPPRRDDTLTLSRSYHPHYDGIVLKAKQARDYFLLQGPPGTGKTSMALRFLVEEELHSNSSLNRGDGASSLLLTAYTNRAVDEICGMLTAANIDYLRVGNEASCDPRYADHLLEEVVGACPKLIEIRQRLLDIRVIVATTTTLQARPFLLQLKRFSLCIIDEASQILEPNVIGLLASDSIGRFILIGDHKQLPAVVQQPDDEPRLHSCRLSLFERLLRQERQAQRTDFTDILRRQGRMHPDIAQFPNEMFYAQEQLQPVPLPHQTEMELDYRQPSEDDLDDLLKAHRVLFLPVTNDPHPCLSDKVNVAEARIVADLLRRIYRQYGPDRFQADKTVGVIVPYRNQIAMIRHEIEQLGLPQLLDISIDTVERYQGSQRDVIIYSFTVQYPWQLDFLTANCFEESDGEHPSVSYTIDRKLNVAMTRARCQLLMTGNTGILSRNAIFKKLIRCYSSSLLL